MSRVRTIARRDLRHALRDRLLWGAVLLLGLMFLPSTATIASPDYRPIDELLLVLPVDLLTFSLVVVAAVGYNAVVGERVTGTVRSVLGLSATRRDLVLAKFLSRATVVVLAMAIVLVVAHALVARGYGQLYLVPYWTMAGWMLLYGVVWTAVTIGFSAAFDSPYRTLGALVGTYAAFSPSVDVWSVVIRPVVALIVTGSTASPTYDGLAAAPLWVRITERLNPLTGFYRAMQWSVGAVGPGTPTGDPVLQVFGAVTFVGFGAVGLAVGVRRFERADLCQDGGQSWLRAVLGRGRRRLATAVPHLPGVARSSDDRSRTLTIAVADRRHAFQQWIVVGAVVLFTLLVVPRSWTTLASSSVSSPTEEIVDITRVFTLPVLVLGIAVGYGAVVGERSSGTVRLVLAATGSRRQLVTGKLAARLTVTAIALLPSIAFAELLVATRFGEPYLAAFLAWACWLLLYAFVWTAFVVGVSAGTSTRYRTLAVVFGTYLLFSTQVGLWGFVVRPLISFAATGRPDAYENYVHAVDRGPAWFRHSDHLNPFIALRTVRDGLFSVVGHGSLVADVPPVLGAVAVSVSLLFAIGSVILGYRRFARADLNSGT